ncbi:MAG: DNA polymerase III subunit alpha, partial [Atribacterota bacterium]|nr:DNA polymerase III subunit alpha [Atribacterota bacterium]
FIERKHGRIKVTYPHPSLEPVLRETYGVIVYQEQVMKIASELAGFTLGQADILRRAMGKKKPEVMREQREKFIQGALAKGHDRGTAEEIFDLIEYFAGYGFNKSHSAAYAIISYQTAYLKAHYPTEYLAACLTSNASDSDKVAKFIGECKRLSIQILPPDINESLANFTVVGEGKIRFGLAAIKNVGDGAIAEILARRRESRFRNIFDFAERVDLRVINKRVLESLIKAGAFDTLHPNRAQLLASLEEIIVSFSKRKKAKTSQISLFGGQSSLPESYPELKEVKELERQELLRMEKEMLGFYVSDHPLREIALRYPHITTVPIGRLGTIRQAVKVKILGVVSNFRKIVTKTGGEMYFVSLEDETGSVEVIFFPNFREEIQPYLSSGKILGVLGRLDILDSGENKVIAEAILDPEKEGKGLSRVVNIDLRESSDILRSIYCLKDCLRRFPGDLPVVVRVRESKEEWWVELGEAFRIFWNPESEGAIKETIQGEGEVWLS